MQNIECHVIISVLIIIILYDSTMIIRLSGPQETNTFSVHYLFNIPIKYLLLYCDLWIPINLFDKTISFSYFLFNEICS